jgi:hypothetical protein
MVAGDGTRRRLRSVKELPVLNTVISALLAAAPTPEPWTVDPAPPPGMDFVANTFFGWGKWILIGAGVLGLFICAGMMIIGRRNRSATAVDGATGIPWVLAGLAVASLAGGIVTTVL